MPLPQYVHDSFFFLEGHGLPRCLRRMLHRAFNQFLEQTGRNPLPSSGCRFALSLVWRAGTSCLLLRIAAFGRDVRRFA